MAKQIWKPGNMVYPLPAVMVSTGDKKGNQNILTVAWTELFVRILQWYTYQCVRSVILII